MTTGIKTISPLHRREGIGHDELVAYWQDRHAPGVKTHMRPDRYSITFFDPRDGRAAYDGMAALAFDDAERAKATTGRNMPAEVANDGFGDRIEMPMTRLTVAENVIVAGPGADGGPASAEERGSAYKMTFFVRAADGQDLEQMHRHWLEIHAPNVKSSFVAAVGFATWSTSLPPAPAGPSRSPGWPSSGTATATRSRATPSPTTASTP